MEFIIIARSTGGWGIAVGGSLMAEFDTPEMARVHAEALEAASNAAGKPADVIDLTRANTKYPLLPQHEDV